MGIVENHSPSACCAITVLKAEMLAFSGTGSVYFSGLDAEQSSDQASDDHWSDAPPLIDRLVPIGVAYK